MYSSPSQTSDNVRLLALSQELYELLVCDRNPPVELLCSLSECASLGAGGSREALVLPGTTRSQPDKRFAAVPSHLQPVAAVP